MEVFCSKLMAPYGDWSSAVMAVNGVKVSHGGTLSIRLSNAAMWSGFELKARRQLGSPETALRRALSWLQAAMIKRACCQSLQAAMAASAGRMVG